MASVMEEMVEFSFDRWVRRAVWSGVYYALLVTLLTACGWTLIGSAVLLGKIVGGAGVALAPAKLIGGLALIVGAGCLFFGSVVVGRKRRRDRGRDGGGDHFRGGERVYWVVRGQDGCRAGVDRGEEDRRG